MNILFAGDYSLQGRVKQCVDIHSLRLLMGGVKSIVENSDFALVNFESPSTLSTEKIQKDGPYLKNHEVAFRLLKDIGFNVFTLANNHLNDYGERGIKDTISKCVENDILYVGAGENINLAKQPLHLTNEERICISIINVCENESSIASENTAGAAPLDIIELHSLIAEEKKIADYVVLVIHGGVEHYNLPTPRMKKVYHFLVDCGADLIVNHHQHCYSGYEIYHGAPIFYGLGNFYFDNIKKYNSPWNLGYMPLVAK